MIVCMKFLTALLEADPTQIIPSFEFVIIKKMVNAYGNNNSDCLRFIYLYNERSEGFTGVGTYGGAVKPRSSVDVDELRSSKSMDDEPTVPSK